MHVLVMEHFRGFFAALIHQYPRKRLVCKETMITLHIFT
jgi:hypothetical protein